MNKPQNILTYYAICSKLKDAIRTGWKKWNVEKPRLESVAEHVYGTQMLALAMYSEYDYDIDIMKVIFMLAIHEIGEATIGDFTPFDISREEKERLEHEAVHKVLENLIKRDEIEKYFLEFDAHKTAEAKFAHQCDKLEAELQCKIYDEGGKLTSKICPVTKLRAMQKSKNSSRNILGLKPLLSMIVSSLTTTKTFSKPAITLLNTGLL